MNKKGYINDIVLFVAMMFLVAVAILVVYMIFDGMNDAITGSDIFDAKEKGVMTDFRDDFSRVWDYTYLTVFVAGLIGLLILSWALQSNPAFFFAILMVVVLVGILAASLSNAFGDATASGVLSTTASNFPIMSYVMNNLLIFILVTAFLMIIVFFGKPGGDV